MQKEVLFAGFGGQGVMFAGQLLAYTAMDLGLEVTWIPSYGPEMRGGTAHCYVVISDRPIGSPIVRHPQIVVAFNQPSFERYAPITAEGGLLIYNVSLITPSPNMPDVQTVPLPASEIADQLGMRQCMNMAMLGSVLSGIDAVTLDAVHTALDNHIPAHRRASLPVNHAALDRGAAFAQNRLIDISV